MADQEVRIDIVADGAKAEAVMSRVGKQAESMGGGISKGSAIGIAGMRGLEVVAADAGRALGVTGEAASVLGRVVGSAASVFGKASVVIGAITVAAYAGKMAYDFFAGSTVEAAAAADKHFASLESEVRSLYSAKTASDALTKANYRLYGAKRDLLLLEYPDQIEREREKITKLITKHEDLQTRLNAVASARARAYGIEGGAVGSSKELDKLAGQIRVAREELSKMEQTYKDISSAKASFSEFSAPKSGKKTDSDPTVTNQYEREAAYQQQLVELYRASGASKAEIWQQELAAFDIATAAKMANARTEHEYYDTLALREIERETLVANHAIAEEKRKAAEKQRLNDLSWQYGTQIAQGLTALMVQHGKKGAEEQKKAARMQAIVNTAAAVTKALPNWYLAALVAAAGAVQISAINSASYGSSGGGTLSLGGSSVSGEQDNYRYFNYEQSTYGSGWRPGMGQGSNTVNIYAMDSKSFEQYVNDNPDAVLNVVDKKEKGYL